MIPVFTLREITVDNRQWPAVFGGKRTTDETFLTLNVIRPIALNDVVCLRAIEKGDAVVGFLTMKSDIVTKRPDLIDREVRVIHFCFLQTDNCGVVLIDDCFKLMKSYSNAIDIK